MAKSKPDELKKSHNINIRLTKEEYEKILSDMEHYGFLSVSRYVRTRLFKTQIHVRNEVVTDRDVRRQINKLTFQIRKIGNNYNTALKKYLMSCNSRRPDGTPVISTRATAHYLKHLSDLTDDVKSLMEKVLDTVDPPQKGDEE